MRNIIKNNRNKIKNVGIILLVFCILGILLFSCEHQKNNNSEENNEKTEQSIDKNKETDADTEKDEDEDADAEADTDADAEADTDADADANTDTDTNSNSDTSQQDEEKKIKLTIQINDKASVYGDNQQVLDYTIVSSSEKKISLKDKDIILSKSAGSNVGVYTISGKCNNSKYDVTFLKGTYTITKRPVTVRIANKSSVYGERLVDLTSDVVEGTIIGKDNLNISLQKSSGNDVGTYDITGKYNNSNYDVKFQKGTYTISSRPITVRIDNKTSVYGDELVGLTSHIEKGDVLMGDTLGISLKKAPGNNAGRYTITGQYSNYNYNVTFENGIYTISKRPISIIIDDKSSFKNEAIVPLTYSISSGSIARGDAIGNVISVSTDANKSVIGDYSIVGSVLNSNYSCTFQNGIYKIRNKPGVPEDATEGGTEDSSGSVRPTPILPEDP